MLFHRHRVIRAALDGGVVADDDAFLARDAADAGDDAGGRRRIDTLGVLVHGIGRHLGKLEEGRAGIEQHLHAVARQQFSARQVLGGSRFAATRRDLFHFVAQIVDDGLHGRGIGLEIFTARIEFAFDLRHCGSFL